MVSLLVASDVGEGLHSRFVGRSSANANGSLDGRNKDLTVAQLSGSRSVLNRRNDLVRLLRGGNKINPDLRHKAERMRSAAANLRVSLLLTESLGFSRGHALHADSRSHAPPLVELEWLGLDTGGD
jgi:hypothetical protein